MKYFDFDDELYKTYHRGRRLATDVLQMWMAEVVSLVEPSSVERVVDLGGGTGRFSIPLGRALDAEIVVVDPAARMIAQVDSRIWRVVARAEALPFPDGFCDAMFASMVLHHVADLAGAAAEIHRVLRCEGALVVRTCFSDTLDAPYHRFFPSVHQLEREVLPTAADLLAVLEAVGLRLLAKRRVRQRQDDNWRSYAERIRLRAASTLRVIPDDEFDVGISELEEFAENQLEPTPVYEEIDLVVFSSAGSGV